MDTSRSPRSQASRRHTTSAQEWSVAECLRILRRRRFTLLWFTCLALLVTTLITLAQPHVYRSRASIEIQRYNDDFLDLREIYPAPAYVVDMNWFMQTQAELLRQDALLEQVARTFHLESRPEYQPPRTFISKLHRDIRVAPVHNSRVIQIVCDAREPRLAADLANSLAQTFIEQSIDTRQQAARQTYASLSLQLRKFRPSGPDSDPRAFAAMRQKVNQARLASGLRQSSIRLIDPAVPGSRPYTPNLPLNLIIGALGGLVIAIGWVMLQEQSSSALDAPGEAGTFLALPELGAIPKDGPWKHPVFRHFNPAKGKLRIERAVLEQGSSHLSESFRATLASILTTPHHAGTACNLVFTSSRPMEGKTTIVSNLGFALAETGRQVLLIDGDMRRPQLHRIFDQPNGWGLSDVLREWNSIEELPLKVLVKKTSVSKLYLLTGGTATDNISGLLHSGRMSKLLTRFREEFDYVLVDSPPCLEFADARNIARFADGLVLVVRARHTDRKTAETAVQRLVCDGISVTGVILNGWDPSRAGHLVRPFEGLGNRAYDLSCRH